MTQITAIIENSADANLIRRIIENVKGVLSASISSQREEKHGENESANELMAEMSAQNVWLKELDRLYHGVDRTKIDFNDERTRYIMSR